MDLNRDLRAQGPVFLLALQFLTRLPVRVDFTPARMAASPRWYPAVGIVVGAVTAVIYWGAALMVPPGVAAVLAVVAGVLVTGALHEDGFADLCDGLGGGRTPERAMEIMRDSRLGTYGVLGLGLMVGGKIAILAALPPPAVPLVLVAGHAASRGAMVWVMARSRYLRASGAGAQVAGQVDAGALRVAGGTVAAVALLALLAVPFWAVVAGALGLVGGHYAVQRRFEARLGGYTGDCLGAVQQCAEAGFLLGVLVALG